MKYKSCHKYKNIIKISTAVNKTPDNADNHKFDFSQSKKTIEFISVLLALIAALGTILLKIVSLGTVICFSFDLNYYDFTLNNTDFILFATFLCMSAITLLYCYFSNNFRKKLSKNALKCKKVTGWLLCALINFLWAIALLLLEFGVLKLLSSISSVALKLTAEFYYCIIFSMLILGLCILFLASFEHNSKYITVGLLIVIIISFAMIETNYDNANEQKCFDIITYDDNNGEPEYYAVISSGDYFSAYICEFSESDENKVLTIYSEKHRFFAIDSVTTEKMYFAEYNVFPNLD